MSMRVAMGELGCGLAVVRPPGHHACPCTAMGFCVFNNVALAALKVADTLGQRVCIVDWDVHHGNGTVDIMKHLGREDILYLSIHYWQHGDFYPGTGTPSSTGLDGSEVNVAWNQPGMGDPEYMAAFSSVVSPLLQEFEPDLILVSAGFDAARGDPLGGMDVTAVGYAAMTHQLLGINPKVVICLEGGYNLQSIAQCAKAVLQVLLDQDQDQDPPCFPAPSALALADIEVTLRALHQTRWGSMAETQLALLQEERFEATHNQVACCGPTKGKTKKKRHHKPGNATAHIPKGPRRTAQAKWKDEVFKLKRRREQLEGCLKKWAAWDHRIAHAGKKPSKKELRELGDREEQELELLRVKTELVEIEDLSEEEAIQLYVSCR
eukprot:TRINITY_DN12622_c0_g2_i2.p1 TRINITY_DN12622_c0_g2~~TRINITY_DN12622_c0_g2_i2.p1  ORF type:complete len:379 (+),score=103.60 TRINITY_DN12622_c0_g2_i2:757-1893(+)